MANTFYFSASSGNDTTGDGSQGNPWRNFKGKKDGVQALSAGDICYFQRGDIWIAESAEVIVSSSGTPANFITLDAYGSGPLPIFAGADITTSGWVVSGISSIYILANQTHSNLKTVTQLDTMALGRWTGNTSSLAEGTFIRVASTLYVHLWGHSDPRVATNKVRVAGFSHSSSGDGARGLVSTARTNSSRGAYVNFNNLEVICANGIGFSASAMSNGFYNCEAVGCGQEGMLFYADIGGTNENAIGGRWRYGSVSWCAANGDGFGQGLSFYSKGGWIVDSVFHDNFMAGADFLEPNASKLVTQNGALRCTFYNNGRWNDSNSFDPQCYIDGGSEVFIYGCVMRGYTNNNNPKGCFAFGSEHASTNPCENVYLINNLIYDNNWVCFNSHNNDTSSLVKNVTIINNTFMAYQGTGYNLVYFTDQADTTANNWVMRNNIFYAYGSTVDDFYYDPTDFLDADFNLFYRDGGNTDIYKLNDISRTLAQWRSATGEDAASIYGDPLLVNASSSTLDAHLKSSSPAIAAGTPNPFTPPSWLPADLFPYGGVVRGIARSDGTVDPGITSLDIGYHYNSGDSFYSGAGITLGQNRLLIPRNSKLTVAV